MTTTNITAQTTQTTPAIVPNFDDDAATGRKLAIICSKGNLDMAYPGLILANAALGEGVGTHPFFGAVVGAAHHARDRKSFSICSRFTVWS